MKNVIITIAITLLSSTMVIAGGKSKTKTNKKPQRKAWAKRVASACKPDTGFKRFHFGAGTVGFKNCIQFGAKKTNKKGITR